MILRVSYNSEDPKVINESLSDSMNIRKAGSSLSSTTKLKWNHIIIGMETSYWF